MLRISRAAQGLFNACGGQCSPSGFIDSGGTPPRPPDKGLRPLHHRRDVGAGFKPAPTGLQGLWRDPAPPRRPKPSATTTRDVYNATKILSPAGVNLPRRYQAPTRKKRSRKGPRPALPQPAEREVEVDPDDPDPLATEVEAAEPVVVARPRPTVATPGPTVPRPSATVPRVSQTVAPVAAPVRHLTRDYGYVRGELRRIAIMLVVVMGGIIGAAAGIRWF